MSEPFLILHKVRGEPAFDIAIQMDVEDKKWWIIPTSGHRAYPYRQWELAALADASDINFSGFHTRPSTLDNLPPDWPDHYPALTSPEPSRSPTEFLTMLGLIPKMTRRF